MALGLLFKQQEAGAGRKYLKLLMPVLASLLVLLFIFYMYYFVVVPSIRPRRPTTLQLPSGFLNTFIPVSAEARPSLEALAPAKTTAGTVETMASTEAKTKNVELTDPFVLRVAVQPLATEKEIANEVASFEARNVEPVLEGIWVGEDMKIAFISGQALIEGSTIMGWRVRTITKNQVVLGRSDGRTKILRLEGQQ